MAKVTPQVDVREYPVVTMQRVESQTGVTLELSNVEAHVIARLLGNIGGVYDVTDPTLLRSITSRLWNTLVEAGYGTPQHLSDGSTWFAPGHNFLTAKEGARPADIGPGAQY